MSIILDWGIPLYVALFNKEFSLPLTLLATTGGGVQEPRRPNN